MFTIERVLSPKQLEMVKNNLKFLTDSIQKSHGELDLQLRRGYLNVYYKGNSLAHITPVPSKSAFTVKVNEVFKLRKIVSDLADKRLVPNDLFSANENGHDVASVDTKLIHVFLQDKVVKKLKSAIKERGFGEEITFEQGLITDNLNRRDLIIIDRQVQPQGASIGKMDLLALRLQDNGAYRFLVLEVKLGCNEELSGTVADQLKRYTDSITANFDTFAKCYKQNYEQKRALGVLGCQDWPESIEIEETVEGRIVVGMYSGYGEKQINEKLLKTHPELRDKIQRCWHRL